MRKKNLKSAMTYPIVNIWSITVNIGQGFFGIMMFVIPKIGACPE